MIYGITLNGDNTVSFKVNNIYGANADVYVKHDTFSTAADGSTVHFLNADCAAVKDQPPCIAPTNPIDNEYTAACRSAGYAYVYVYFATTDSAVVEYTGEGAIIPECCYPDDYSATGEGVVQFAYTIYCDCPTSTPARKLLRGKEL
jgi:hypothetical protein